jgi:Ulp1 protease family, C-terminal catalytic domain
MLAQIILFLLIFIVLLVVIFSFSPLTNKSKVNKIPAEETSDYQESKEWFAPYRWLTDKEIDWATERLAPKMPGSFPHNHVKILPAWQFYLVRNAERSIPEAKLAFQELVQELNCSEELVFIPVNQTNYHWSLLVYETSTKTFYHYDTLHGVNYEYMKPLVKELLQQIHSTNQVNLSKYLVPKHDIHQGNSYDCGIAVISIIQRIREKYNGNMEGIKLGVFDFKRDREELRKRYLEN